jgi:hypothetical protein
VTGQITVSPGTAGPVVVQTGFTATFYHSPVDGPAATPGTPGIDSVSKDLAFVLYTRPTPEPASIVMVALGAARCRSARTAASLRQFVERVVRVWVQELRAVGRRDVLELQMIDAALVALGHYEPR